MSLSNLRSHFLFQGGWRRNLVAEGIEPNPGPSWPDFLEMMKQKLEDEYQKAEEPLSALKRNVEKWSKVSDFVGVTELWLYLDNNREELLASGFNRILLGYIDEVLQGCGQYFCKH